MFHRGFLVHTCLLVAMAAVTLPAASRDSYRLCTFGNSLTMSIGLSHLIELAETRGQTLVWERVGIAGTSLDFLWDNREQQIKDLLGKGDWDGMSLQPFNRSMDSDLPMVVQFTTQAVQTNPAITTWIYAQYIYNSGLDYQQVWRQDVSEYLATGSRRDLVLPQRTRGYFEVLTLQAREQMPDRTILMAPVGHAFALFDEKIKAGLVPGITSIYQCYKDGTHCNHVGSYLAGMTYYAILFHQSPVGLPIGGYQGGLGEHQITEEQARIMQETAWEIAATHPLAGVTGVDEPVAIVTPSIHPRAIQHEPFRKELTAAFGSQPFTWSIAEGKLPAGLALSQDGLIVGTATETGSFPFVAQVRDASGAIATRSFTLQSEVDATPRILTTDTDLGTYRAGETITKRFEAEGGNGQLKWSLEVPKGYKDVQHFGVDLRADGLLSGSIGQPGDYTFIARLQDADMSQPEVLEQEYQLTITEPGSEVLSIYALPENVSIIPWHQLRRDGHEDFMGDFFRQFEQITRERAPVERLVRGPGSDNKAAFLAWYEDNGTLGILVEVEDADIVTDRQQPSQGDSVEIYLDILNNREKVYNADDRRFIVTPDGSKTGSDDVKYASVWRSERGYMVQISLPSHKLKRKAEPWVVMGLDIAVNDQDAADGEVSTLMWRGDGLHEEDTSGFGTIICTPMGE